MLKNLIIKNIAVIEQADLTFDGGLNIMTGETGAGKSIVIDSIGAVTGARMGREIVRSGSEYGFVSATFDGDAALPWLAENEIEPEDCLIVQRRIGADGKTACKVNGIPVTVSQLRDLSAWLIDIHGQNDGRCLLNEKTHVEFLDRFAGLGDRVIEYRALYRQYGTAKHQLEELNTDEEEKARQLDMLYFRIAELESADIKPGEKEEIASRLEILRNFEKLNESLSQALSALSESDGSALNLSQDASYYLSRAAAYAPALEKASEDLKSAIFTLSDVSEVMRDFLESLDFSQPEYDRLESRLYLINKLERKYNRSSDEFRDDLDQMKKKVLQIQNSDLRREELADHMEALRKQCLSAADSLGKMRLYAAQQLRSRVNRELKDLSMPAADFCVELTPYPAGEFDSHGNQEVRFLLAANRGEKPGRLSKVASGGEMSRVMLAMKNVFSGSDPVPTMIFDEIDTGVSGVAAQRVGEKLYSVSCGKQVLCVTHLPQIAAMADAHYCIEKTEQAGRTYTLVNRLDREGQCREIARMYGGDNITPLTLTSAAEQLQKSEEYKKKEKLEHKGEDYNGNL